MLARKLFNSPTIAWGNPFAEMDRMINEMDRWTRALSERPAVRFANSGVFPPVNITEDTDKYYVHAELPGITAKNLDVQIIGRNLTLSGERKIETLGDGVKYHRREREAGKFSRVIGLPGDVDANKVDAKLENGMLTIAITKSEAAKPKQIAVH